MWDKPRKYLIVFTQRGGSTFLAHCLDSHLDIGCERGEPLFPKHIWSKMWPNASPGQILSSILERPGYRVTMARVNYRHLRQVPLGFMEELDGIVHLHRHNAVRVLVSSAINTRQLKLPHTYNSNLPPAQIEIDPRWLNANIAKYLAAVRGTRKALHEFDVPLLMLRYDEIVGGEGQEASEMPVDVTQRICWFLGVNYQTLRCRLRRTNPETLPEIISNWQEVKKVLRKAGYGCYLNETD